MPAGSALDLLVWGQMASLGLSRPWFPCADITLTLTHRAQVDPPHPMCKELPSYTRTVKTPTPPVRLKS